MEHRRRTLSSAIIDIETETSRSRITSIDNSIDDTINDYNEYVYNGTFSFSDTFSRYILNLICPCFKKERVPISLNSE